MNKLPITLTMISSAEAARIGRALESVAGWTSEIIIVLNENVRDGTEEIALKFGAKVCREPWKGFIAQKNSAAQKATQDWILNLDADEAVSPALRDEIMAAFARGAGVGAPAAYGFPRLTFYCGRWIRHGDWYPDRCVRLWRRGAAEWTGEDPHASLTVRGPVENLRSDLLHHNTESIDHQIAKITAYSNDFVRNSLKNGRGTGWFDLAFRPMWRFVRSYFFRLGFLDGWQGYYIAWSTAFYTATRYAKVREALLARGKDAATGAGDASKNA